MRIIAISVAALALLTASPALAQQKPDPAKVDAAVKASLKTFPAPPEVWQPRLDADETMKACSASDNSPPKAVVDAIAKRERGSIEYPPDGQFIGDWKKGEATAQSGYGLRSTDYPATRANGGNCYACHQLSKAEVSYGTIGPSLLGYGKLREFKADEVKIAYEKVYNSHAAFPCSLMPRFGSNKVLTMDQIKDLVALLMSKDSPVNQ
jgi:sulfur-oxidizing protein SoxX